MSSSCPKRFENKQGLSVHIKCLHGGATAENNSQSTGEISYPDNLNCVHQDKLIEKDIEFVLGSVLKKVEGNIIKHQAVKNKIGKKRYSYTAIIKTNIVNMVLKV